MTHVFPTLTFKRRCTFATVIVHPPEPGTATALGNSGIAPVVRVPPFRGGSYPCDARGSIDLTTTGS